MKKWGLRILTALLTFTLGLCAAAIVRFILAPAAKIRPVYDGAKIQVPTLPSRILEAGQPPDDVDENAQPPDEGYVPIQPHIVAISPYEIKRILDNDELPTCEHGECSGYPCFDAVWKKLKLKISDAETAVPGRCEVPSKASIYTLELDGKPGKESLLRLDFGEPYASLYLVFKDIRSQGNSRWHLLGSLPYSYGAPFVPPSHKFVSDGQHRWLVIDYSTGHGSAFGSGADDWYEVSESGVRKVLSYQNGLFIGFSNPGVDRDTKVLNCEYRDGITTVVIQASTSYGSYDEESYEPFSLWSNKRRAVFVRSSGMKTFLFDSRRSEMSAKEIDPHYGGWADISNEDILKYNYRDLAKIAAKGNGKQKEWLRDFLDNSDDSPEKESLRKALERGHE